MSKPVILLVDDDQGMIELLSMRIEALGYEVRSAENGIRALDAMDSQVPDLVVSDLRMEPMNGMVLFENISQRWPTLPVIMLTAHGSIPEAVTATQKGVFSFLTKPVKKDELATVIAKALKHLPTEASKDSNWDDSIYTRSAKMLRVIEQAKLLANSNVNVLITGESGTGKELLARALHTHSNRANQPFVALNCSALPADMLESELFGHVKGAFTGATRDHEGLICTANGGMLLLDEIGDMPLNLQAKLLRVLQEKRVRRVGDTKEFDIDVRIISATHRNLLAAIEANQFREDLFYRLNVVNLHLPSLRERMEDIGFLSTHLLQKIARREGQAEKKLAPQALERLLDYDWPGNVRQLENVLEQAFALSRGSVISDTLVNNALPNSQQRAIAPLSDAKRDFERDYVIELLRSTEGQVTLAAKLAGRNRSDFYKIISRHRIDVDRFKTTDEKDMA
jgi:two-component system response regulator GlrR